MLLETLTQEPGLNGQDKNTGTRKLISKIVVLFRVPRFILFILHSFLDLDISRKCGNINNDKIIFLNINRVDDNLFILVLKLKD